MYYDAHLTLDVMNTQGLDDFSRSVAEQLFAQFPSWRELAQIEHADDGAGYLLLEVAAPADASAAYGLTVTTDNAEVTVGFDYYHGHFFGQVGDGERFGTDYALHFLSQLLNEEVAVVSWWLAGNLVAFSTIENGKALMDDALVGKYDRERVRSWKGTLNADRNV